MPRKLCVCVVWFRDELAPAECTWLYCNESKQQQYLCGYQMNSPATPLIVQLIHSIINNANRCPSK